MQTILKGTEMKKWLIKRLEYYNSRPKTNKEQAKVDLIKEILKTFYNKRN